MARLTGGCTPSTRRLAPSSGTTQLEMWCVRPTPRAACKRAKAAQHPHCRACARRMRAAHVGRALLYVRTSSRGIAVAAASGDRSPHACAYHQVQTRPAVVGGVVYVGSQDRVLYALNAATGTKLWSYTTWGNVRAVHAARMLCISVGASPLSCACMQRAAHAACACGLRLAARPSSRQAAVVGIRGSLTPCLRIIRCSQARWW